MSHLPARIAAPMLRKVSYGCLSSDAWERLALVIFLCRVQRLSNHRMALAQHRPCRAGDIALPHTFREVSNTLSGRHDLAAGMESCKSM